MDGQERKNDEQKDILRKNQVVVWLMLDFAAIHCVCVFVCVSVRAPARKKETIELHVIFAPIWIPYSNYFALNWIRSVLLLFWYIQLQIISPIRLRKSTESDGCIILFSLNSVTIKLCSKSRKFTQKGD